MYIVTIATCSASGVSALLVCTALHPQMSCRHCIKCRAYVDQNSGMVSSLVVFDSHKRARW